MKPKNPHSVHGSARTGDLSAGRPAGLSDRWTVPGICLFLAAATWLVFGQTIHHGFVNLDDDVYVYENPVVQKGLTLQGIIWAFTHVHSSNWHPLTWLSHMADCQLYGLNPGGHHLTNILLHMATAILLFLVLRRMTGFLWRSAFVAAVFAIHPLRVESVAWVAERKDVLSGLFFLLTIGAYVRYARRPWSPARYGLVVFLFALGLMTKPMLVTLPFVLLLLDYWPLGRVASDKWRVTGEKNGKPATDKPRLSTLLLEKLPLFGMAAAASAVTLFAQTRAIGSFQQISLPLRVGNALVSCVAYLGQMIYPTGLAVFYPHPGGGLALWKSITAFVLLLAISTGAVAAWRKRPWFLFGWLWYLGMLVPVIGILQVGSQARADRYTYLPQIGLYVLLTWAAADWCAGWRHRRLLLGGCSAVILAALIFCAQKQTSYWRNSESLWTRTLACTSDNFVAHNNLGNVLVQKGRVGEAIFHYQKALQIKPDSPEAHLNLGYAFAQKGNVDEAIVHFQKAVEIKPDYAEAQCNLGNALHQQGRVAEAIICYQKALQIKPDYAEACYNLGNNFFQNGEVDEAIVYYQKALQIKPDYVAAQNNLGNALLQEGRVDEAITHYQKALQIKSDYTNACYTLGLALLQKGNVDEAIAHFQKVLQIKPDHAAAYYNLGNALLQKGKVDEAITHYQKALQIKPGYPEAQNDLAWLLATAPQATMRNGNKAVELAQRANQLTGGADLDILGTLAAAYAEAGRFDAAIQSARKAIDLARATGQQDQVMQLNAELKFYEAGLPFHQENK